MDVWGGLPKLVISKGRNMLKTKTKNAKKNFFLSKPIGLTSNNTVTANPPLDLDVESCSSSSVPVSSIVKGNHSLQSNFLPQAYTSMGGSSVTVDLHNMSMPPKTSK